MLAAAIILGVVALAFWPAVQVLRGVVDARRVRETGIGGTQDIAMWATLVSLLLFVAAGATMYLAAASLRERLNH